MRGVWLLFSLLVSQWAMAQREIKLEQIWGGDFEPRGVRNLRLMNDDKHYTALESEGVVQYKYDPHVKVKVLIPGRFTDYVFSLGENYALLELSAEPIYRRSKRGRYEIFSFKDGRRVPLFDGKAVQEPLFSPDEKKIAFVYENDLYYQDLASGSLIRATRDGQKGQIINGIADWVYQEEFHLVRAFDWNADGSLLAYLRFDESQVPEYVFNLYGAGLYPEDIRIKYPKAGEKNAKVSAHYYVLSDRKTREVDLSAYQDFYIPMILFTKKPDELCIVTSNRRQNQMDLLIADTRNHSLRKLFSEKDEAYLRTDLLTLDFLPDNSFVWASERDGFQHLYHYTADGRSVRAITRGLWEVTRYYGYDPLEQRVYYQSTEEGSANLTVSSIGLDGKNQRKLSGEKGSNEADFSKNFAYFVNIYSRAGRPPVYSLIDTKTRKKLAVLEDNAALVEKLQTVAPAAVEFFKVPSASKETLEAWMIKPKDFDPTKEYPLLMYVYGGPGSKTVLNAWGGANYLWFQMLAQKGYIVASVDNRGTGKRGAAFEKLIYKKMGRHELEDQIAAAQHFGRLPYVSARRIGMFGWSFGGYLTSLALTKAAGVFKTGIAVAPVTHWRFYDTIYTERYLGAPQENPEGYDQNSPLFFFRQLKGNYLLIHGTADDNVHFQNSLQMAEALIQSGIPFDFMAYPDRDHGIYGGNARLHLYDKMTRYLLEKL